MRAVQGYHRSVAPERVRSGVLRCALDRLGVGGMPPQQVRSRLRDAGFTRQAGGGATCTSLALSINFNFCPAKIYKDMNLITRASGAVAVLTLTRLFSVRDFKSHADYPRCVAAVACTLSSFGGDVRHA